MRNRNNFKRWTEQHKTIIKRYTAKGNEQLAHQIVLQRKFSVFMQLKGMHGHQLMVQTMTS
jgi:hypothetical protein